MTLDNTEGWSDTAAVARSPSLPVGEAVPPQNAASPGRTETPQERHARRLAWGAEWGQILSQLGKRHREKAE